jgi:hypothetical protein
LIRRVHRSFIKKYIFKQKPKYKCGNCQTFFFNPLLEKDFRENRKRIRESEVQMDAYQYIEYETIIEKKA